MPSGRVIAPRTRISKKKWDAFLEALSRHGNVSQACRLVDVSAQVVRNHCRNNSYFNARFEEAKKVAVEYMDYVAWCRATQGTEKIVVSNGRVVRHRGKVLVEREFSDKLLMFLLQAHGGDTYRAKTDSVVHGQVDITDVRARLLGRLATVTD